MSRIFIVLLGLSSFWTSHAGAQTDEPTKLAMTILENVLKCPLQTESTSQGDGAFVTKLLTINRWQGDSRMFRMTGVAEITMHEAIPNKLYKQRQTTSYTVRFSDLASVTADDKKILLKCSGGKECIESTLKFEPLCLGMDFEICNGKPFNEERVRQIEIELCDKDRAAEAYDAFEHLVSASRDAQKVAIAGRQCKVADPSGTPLNVRIAPSGAIARAPLNNGSGVLVLSERLDPRGRPWAQIALADDKNKRAVGFVLAAYLNCDG